VSPSIDSCSRAPSFPTPRVLPFLSSPAFCRYYGGAQTPFPPALARTYLAAQSRGVGLVFVAPSSGRLACWGRGRCFPVSSCSGCWSLVWSGSPVFHGLPLDGLPCSSTPPVSSDLAYRSSDFAPVNAMTKALGNKCHFVAHSHGFPSRGLRFMPPSRTTMQDSLSVRRYPLAGGFHPAWEALRRFRPCGSPQAFASCSVCLSLSFGSFWFLLLGLSPPPCLCTAPRIRILPPGSRALGRFEMGIGGSPSTGLGAGCWVVPWCSSRRTMNPINSRFKSGHYRRFLAVAGRGKIG